MTLREILGLLCRTSGMPQSEIASRADLSVNALRKRLCGAIGLSADDLRQILHALGVSWAELGDIIQGTPSPILFLAQESRRKPRQTRYFLRDRKASRAQLSLSEISSLAEELEEIRLLNPQKASEQSLKCFLALRNHDPTESPRSYTLTYITLGASWGKRGKTSAAARALLLALAAARTDAILKSRVLQATSTFALNQTRLDIALRAAQLAILEALHAGSVREIGRGFAAQGAVQIFLGLYEESKLSYDTARTYLREVRARWYEQVAVLQGLGVALTALGDLEASERAISEALHLVERSGQDVSDSVATKGPLLWLQSEILLYQGRFQEAIARFQDVFYLYEEGGSPLDLVLISLRLAEAYIGSRQDPGQLWTYLETLLAPLARCSQPLSTLLGDFLKIAIRGRATVEVVRRTYSAIASVGQRPEFRNCSSLNPQLCTTDLGLR